LAQTTQNSLASPYRQWYFAPMKNKNQTTMIPRPERGVLRHPAWQYGKSEQNISIITWELPSESLADMITSHIPVLFKFITGDYESEVL
jgi:hypothetical protein